MGCPGLLDLSCLPACYMSGQPADLQHLFRYRWHMEDVRSWLLVPRQGGVKAFNMPASSEEKPAGKGLPQPPPGKSQRPQLTGENFKAACMPYHHVGTPAQAGLPYAVLAQSCQARSCLIQAWMQAQNQGHKHLDLSSSGSTASDATPGRSALPTSPKTTARLMACSSTAAAVTIV